MNIMAELRSCKEILANDIKIYTTDQYILHLINNYKVYIPGGSPSLRGTSGLDMYDISHRDSVRVLINKLINIHV